MENLKRNSPYTSLVGGFIVPKEFINGCTLEQIEKIIGFRKERLKKGAIFVELTFLPGIEELEYFGDTRVPADKYEERRTKDISKKQLSKSAYQYFQPSSKLIKVIPVEDPFSKKIENKVWPPGHGAMQYKLKSGVKKSAKYLTTITNYPDGYFQG